MATVGVKGLKRLAVISHTLHSIATSWPLWNSCHSSVSVCNGLEYTVVLEDVFVFLPSMMNYFWCHREIFLWSTQLFVGGTYDDTV